MRFLAIDPGDMTGWSLWDDADYLGGGQTPNWPFVDRLDNALTGFDEEFDGVQRLIVEDFRIYPHKCKDLAWDEVMTARVIGALMLLARQHNLEYVSQPAKIKETAVAGGAEELFVSPRHENRHQNDSIMHGVYYVQTKLLNPGNARVENGRLVPGEKRAE